MVSWILNPSEGEPVCEDGDARLVGGQLNTEGLLEICVGETWNTVYWCDYWNSSEASASVVCRQMNYSRFGKLVCSYVAYQRMQHIYTRLSYILTFGFRGKCQF